MRYENKNEFLFGDGSLGSLGSLGSHRDLAVLFLYARNRTDGSEFLDFRPQQNTFDDGVGVVTGAGD